MTSTLFREALTVFRQLAQKEKNFHLVDVNRDLDAIVDDITRTILKETARKTARIMK